MKINILVMATVMCWGSPLRVLADDYVAVQKENDKSEEKTESNNKVLDNIYSVLKTKVLSEKPELSKFDRKLDELIKEFNPEVDADEQSSRFWSMAQDFAASYEHNFPVGRIKNKLLGKISIKKGFDEQDISKECMLYHVLSGVFVEKAKIYGTSSRVEKIKKANELLRVSILLGLDSDFSDMRGFRISLLMRDAKRNDFLKKFFDQNKELSLFSKETYAHTVKCINSEENAINLIAKIASEKRPATEVERRSVQNALEEVIKNMENDYASSLFRYRTVKAILWFREISLASSDVSSGKMADNMLLNISEKAPSCETKAWAKEALTQKGSK